MNFEIFPIEMIGIVVLCLVFLALVTGYWIAFSSKMQFDKEKFPQLTAAHFESLKHKKLRYDQYSHEYVPSSRQTPQQNQHMIG